MEDIFGPSVDSLMPSSIEISGPEVVFLKAAEAFSHEPLIVVDAFMKTYYFNLTMVNLVLAFLGSSILVMDGAIDLVLCFCGLDLPVFFFIITGMEGLLVEFKHVQAGFCDPLVTLLIPEEFGTWFLIVHDPIGVKETLMMSSGTEQAVFGLLSTKEVSKGSIADPSGATMMKGEQEVMVASL